MILLLAAGTYMLLVYVLEGAGQYRFSGTFPLMLALFFYAFSLIPISLAFSKREHPVRVEALNESLRLMYLDGRTLDRRWTEGPVDLAHDRRKATRKSPPGLEVTLFVPVGGSDPQVPALRPQELVVSGRAFEDILSRMEGAGYKAKNSTLGKAQITIWSFEKAPEPDGPE
jgi:hypothetical protein